MSKKAIEWRAKGSDVVHTIPTEALVRFVDASGEVELFIWFDEKTDNPTFAWGDRPEEAK